jgi:hypothetical protein
VASSLTRGRACRLLLLLALAREVILQSNSRGTHDHILLSQIRDSPNLEVQVPLFISLATRYCVSLFITTNFRKQLQDNLFAFYSNMCDPYNCEAHWENSAERRPQY